MGSPNSSPRCQRAELVALLGRTLGNTVAADVVDRTGAELGFHDAALPLDAAYEVLDALAASPGVIGTAASIARTELRVTAMRRSFEGQNRR
jgi:hypothetical protein